MSRTISNMSNTDVLSLLATFPRDSFEDCLKTLIDSKSGRIQVSNDVQFLLVGIDATLIKYISKPCVDCIWFLVESRPDLLDLIDLSGISDLNRFYRDLIEDNPNIIKYLPKEYLFSNSELLKGILQSNIGIKDLSNLLGLSDNFINNIVGDAVLNSGVKEDKNQLKMIF